MSYLKWYMNQHHHNFTFFSKINSLSYSFPPLVMYLVTNEAKAKLIKKSVKLKTIRKINSIQPCC